MPNHRLSDYLLSFWGYHFLKYLKDKSKVSYMRALYILHGPSLSMRQWGRSKVQYLMTVCYSLNLPLQLVPFPSYPPSQVHVKLPSVLVQSPCAE